MKILTAESNLAAATNISNTPVVRVYNSDSSAITLTRKDNTGTTIGSYSVPPNKVIYCEKFYTDTLEGSAALKVTGVGYSEELDIICLGNGGGGLPVTANLLYHFDAADSSSGDSTWTDKSNNSINGTINGATYNSADGGSWIFDGTNDYISANWTPSNTAAITLIAFIKRNGEQNTWASIITNRITSNSISKKTANLNFYSNQEDIAYSWVDSNISSSWNNDSNLNVPDDEWCMVAATLTSGNQDVYLYKNSGTTTYSTTHTTNNLGSDQLKLIIGSDYDPGPENPYRYYDGKISIVLGYTAILTQTELTSIWDAYKSRYGY